MKILVFDNYDSFTYNLVQYLGEMGEGVEVRRNNYAWVRSRWPAPEVKPRADLVGTSLVETGVVQAERYRRGVRGYLAVSQGLIAAPSITHIVDTPIARAEGPEPRSLEGLIQ